MKGKKLLISLLLLCIMLFAIAGCSDTNSIEHITDMERFSDMQQTTDSIDVKFDNHTGKPFNFTIEAENDIAKIMNIVLSDKLKNLGKEFPPGDNTYITIHQEKKAYSLSVRINNEKDTYYAFSDKLQNKIIELAIAQGAYDTQVGVIYKVIDLQEIESVKEEKITVDDNTTLLSLLNSDYYNCEYFYLIDSENWAERYYTTGITENELAKFQYKSQITLGENRLLVMWHIYQNYNAESYYLTSPSMSTTNIDKSFMEFAFGLWHNYYLTITIVS
ncbi:MAG: hypothetical protein HFK06_02615 [Clostridia bacterium]|nr:hypothetical protein [Clostridia bacterium]